jgi:hypothetical protein
LHDAKKHLQQTRCELLWETWDNAFAGAFGHSFLRRMFDSDVLYGKTLMENGE